MTGMEGGSALTQGREAYAKRAWLEAYESLSAAERHAALEAPDAELLATCVFMLGRDDESVAWLERAHQRHLESGDSLRAVHCAVWIGLNLASRGQIGPATGWLGRAQRLLENEGECAERGYLLLPAMFQHEAAGDFASAAEAAGEAVRIGERFGDRDLFALAIHGQGYMLMKDGRVREGLALLDEAMVAITAEELSPIVTGIVYCGVILACQEVYEVRRAREWTRALSDWWALQPEMVAFTGRCLVHRAEILQLDGSWPDALAEARRAGDRFVETRNPAAGLARYRQGELLRLQGEFAAAERAYKEASGFGWEPQPGLAQLRLAQGRTEAAAAAIRRAEAATSLPLERARLLPAFVEIMLAVGETEAARQRVRRARGARARVRQRDAGGAGSPMRRARSTSRRATRRRPSSRCGVRVRPGMRWRRRTRSRGRACWSARPAARWATKRPRRWSSRRRATSSSASVRSRISRDWVRARPTRTASRGGSSRSCDSSPRGRATARSLRRS